LKAVSGLISIVVLATSMVSSIVLLNLRPPTGLAAPSALSLTEVEVFALVFLLSVTIIDPLKNFLGRHLSSVYGLLQAKIELPVATRALALVMLGIGSFVFAFWSIADLLGGYSGYNYSFSAHPFLAMIYNIVGLRYIRTLEVGLQASVFLLLALAGLTMLRLNRGIGTALKDSFTLFAAPCVITFELALWYFATDDMSWHATIFLSQGGVADLGWRVAGGGGEYLVSNWLVLSVALFLVASRIPWLGLPSRFFWYRGRLKTS